jgi:ubiquinone/menaquinone biosynthesis C-methylase UbiE
MTDAEGELPLDNPTLVRWEFASEERLGTRNAIYRRLVEGVNAEDLVFEAVREVNPMRVLEVGCGAGELSERIASGTGAEVTAVDTSERMVKLTANRGIDAQVADVQALPFDDASFDCVVAGWVLYHVAERDRAIAECARVVRPRGRFVASTMADDNISELWEFLGHPRERSLTFSSANGLEQLQRHFASVQAREAHSVVVFPSPQSMRQFVAANITRAYLASEVPQFDEPVRVRSHHTVFVAEKG